MSSFDEEIARRLQAAADAGELRLAKGYGKPMEVDSAWESTPATLRMPMKILKDAGAAPPEIALFHERARLRGLIEATADASEQHKLQRQLVDLEQKIALRLEMLQINART